MRKPFVGWLCAMVLAGTEGTAPGPGFSCNTDNRICGRVFVLAIGVDGEEGGAFHFRYAASDAKGLVERLLQRRDTTTGVDTASTATRETRLRLATRALEDPADSTSEVQVALLTNAGAFRDNVIRAMRSVAAKARRSDAIVFSFSGVSFSLPAQDSASPGKHYFALAGIRDPRDSVVLRERGLAVEELQRWLDNVLPSQQLVLVEAGDTRSLVTDFFVSLVEANQQSSDLSSRNRVILGPRDVGQETDQGGPLFGAIAQSPFPVTEVFLAGRRAQFEASLVHRADSLAKRSGYARVIYERDILDILRPLVARATGATRSQPASASAPADKPVGTGGRNYALIVGTDTYLAAKDWGELKNPSFDAKAIAKELSENYGFETTLLINPSRDSIFNWIRTLKGKLGRTSADSSQDQVLVFIAGHGLYDQDWGWGYLVTHDSDPLTEDPLRKSYLKHNDLADWLDRIPSKHVMVVLDACFGGAFSDVLAGSWSRDGAYSDANPTRFIQEKMKYASRFYLTSGGKEYVKDGRPGFHSPFASRFLGALRTASAERQILTMSRLRARIEGLLPDPRGGPFGENHQAGGDFLFVPNSVIR